MDNLPFMLFADKQGRIYEHPYLKMAGFWADEPVEIEPEDLIPLPEFSKLFFIPDCHPIGIDPGTGEYLMVETMELEEGEVPVFAVAAFMEPGYVRTHLPATYYDGKSYVLPMWAYTAVGFRDDQYWATGFQVEYNHRWDPRNYDDTALIPAIESYQMEVANGPLVQHLVNCATDHHCFAAKNLFLRRWEAPLPVSQACNASCLGCLSLQPDGSCEASHTRICFRPSVDEIVTLAVSHLEIAEDAIMSFGQGCEGEPLTEADLIAESIRQIRGQTDKGTVNLNTNGSLPQKVREIAMAGLDSIRISLNSARPELYNAYYRPRGYGFEDVVRSITISREMDLYTMVNYLIFPGITDQEAELESLIGLIRATGVNFIHLKNLNIDPDLYLKKMPGTRSTPLGIRKAVEILKQEFPGLSIGYFNQPIRKVLKD